MRSVEVIAAKEVDKKKFTFSNVTLEDISDVSGPELFELSPESFDMVLNVVADYEGTPPESYRVLNAIVLDYVEEHMEGLEKLFSERIIEHFDQEDSAIDIGEFRDDPTEYIWEEQVDYMPSVDEENKKIHFSIELVIGIEDA